MQRKFLQIYFRNQSPLISTFEHSLFIKQYIVQSSKFNGFQLPNLYQELYYMRDTKMIMVCICLQSVHIKK